MQISPVTSSTAYAYAASAASKAAPHDLSNVTVTGPADNLLEGITVAHDNTAGLGDKAPKRAVDVLA